MRTVYLAIIIILALAAFANGTDFEPSSTVVKLNQEFVETYLYPDEDIRYEYIVSSKMFAEPDEEADIIEEDLYSYEGPIRITDALSILHETPAYPEDYIYAQTYYITWWKIKVGDKEGWVRSRSIIPDYVNDVYPFINPPIAIVRFKEDYKSLREGPGADYKIADYVTGTAFNRFKIRPEIKANEILNYIGSCSDWICVGSYYSGAWLPVNSELIELYFLTYVYCPEDMATLAVYYQGTDNIDRIYTLTRGYLSSDEDLRNEPLARIITDKKGYEIYPKNEIIGSGHEALPRYYEYELPEVINTEDIESISYTYGPADNRITISYDLK